MTSRALTVLALLAAACAPEAPPAPTWDDVRPILAANCARCHGPEPKGGAPAGFRLDTYDAAEGRLGAAQMARFVAARAGRLGTMPPDWPLHDRQRETLIAWWEQRAQSGLPAAGDPTANRAPTIAFVDPPAIADQTAVLPYQAHDEDRELLVGELTYARVVDCASRVRTGEPPGVVGALHDGQGALAWDTGVVPPGDYLLTATLRDAIDRPPIDVGCVTVAHEGGNTAPTVRVAVPDALVADADGPVAVDVTAVDPDGDPLTVTIEAFRGDEVVPVVALPWDARAVPEGTTWRLRVVASDGVATRAAVSGYLIVSHATTTETFAAVRDEILVPYCTPCHAGAETRVPGLFLDLWDYDDVRAHRAAIWRRAVEQRDQPPQSATSFDDLGATIPAAPLPPALRDRLSSWILAGAPP